MTIRQPMTMPSICHLPAVRTVDIGTSSNDIAIHRERTPNEDFLVQTHVPRDLQRLGLDVLSVGHREALACGSAEDAGCQETQLGGMIILVFVVLLAGRLC